MTVVVSYIGYSNNVIAEVQANMPVAEAGIIPGDEIISINDTKVKQLSDLSAVLKQEEATYQLGVKHVDGTIEVKTVSTRVQEDGVARFGFSVGRTHSNILYNLKMGFVNMIEMIKQIWSSLIQLVTGQVAMDQVAGIVGIVDQTSKQWNTGMEIGGLSYAIIQLIYVGAIISANLGVFNLLPIPALDGGRLVFIIIEMIRGKAISAEKEGAVHFVGMVLLMLLTVVVLYNDLVRMGLGQ